MDFSEFLPPRAHAVLHYGREDDGMAQHFRRIQPDCRYVSLAGGGKMSAPGGFFGASASLEPADCGVARPDCIVYEGKAVAGLTTELLRRHSACLAPRGQMIVVLPNPAYLRNFLGAFSGEGIPSGQEMGLVGFYSMLEDAGLLLCGKRAVYRHGDEDERKQPKNVKLLSALQEWQREQGGEIQDPWAWAFLLRIVPKQAIRPLFVHALLGEAMVTARIRLTEPHEFLMTEPGVLYKAQQRVMTLSKETGEVRKILLRQRLSSKSVAEVRHIVGLARQYGYLMVFEIDDNPGRWQEDYGRSEWMDFRASHVCQVSTQPLADIVRQYNPHVKVFRNELRELPPKREHGEGEPVTLFFGALNREKEWKEIMPVLNEAAARYGERLRFRVLADKEFFAALRTEHKEFIGDMGYYEGKYVPYPVYTRTLHTADISLLPLHDTEFNRMKSDLKFIESAGHGAVVLASPTVYASSVRDGDTGFLYHSPGEFAERLRILVEDRPRRLAMAEAAYRYVAEERLLSRHYEERLAWYEELFARREELERDLEARLGMSWKRE